MQPTHSVRHIRSLVHDTGLVEVSIQEEPVAPLAADEVCLKVEAAPINPSDIGLMLAGADPASASTAVVAGRPVTRLRVGPSALASLAQRVNTAVPVGLEGAGIVVAAGNSAAARALVGRTVATMAGGMYSELRCVSVSQCLVLPDGTDPKDAASCFVNPLTALGMVETMRLQGHKALVHTAAASGVGRILNRICLRDGIGLVNVVRRAEQADLLRREGATHVCDSSSPDFVAQLTEAITHVGATVAFDATGGGELAGQILASMEAALNRTTLAAYSRYGSSTHKQLYFYGGLDPRPVEFRRTFGMAWSMGGWLLTSFLQKLDPSTTARLRGRIVSELKTTFASEYAKDVSLEQALAPSEIAEYSRRTTGGKYLVVPQRR